MKFVNIGISIFLVLSIFVVQGQLDRVDRPVSNVQIRGDALGISGIFNLAELWRGFLDMCPIIIPSCFSGQPIGCLVGCLFPCITTPLCCGSLVFLVSECLCSICFFFTFGSLICCPVCFLTTLMATLFTSIFGIALGCGAGFLVGLLFCGVGEIIFAPVCGCLSLIASLLIGSLLVGSPVGCAVGCIANCVVSLLYGAIIPLILGICSTICSFISGCPFCCYCYCCGCPCCAGCFEGSIVLPIIGTSLSYAVSEPMELELELPPIC